MKKFLNGLLLILLLGGLSGCRNEFDPEDPGNNRSQLRPTKPQMKTIRMSFGGDFVTESEEPLTRDGAAPVNYKAVNIYCTENKAGAQEEIYAYGVFMDHETLSVNLLTGYKYRFEATVVVDDRDRIVMDGNKYNRPFQSRQVGTSAYDGLKPSDLDHFHYSSEEKISRRASYELHQLKQGWAHVSVAGDPNPYGEVYDKTIMKYPRIKRFYGTYENYDPLSNDSIIRIQMAYKCFGLSIVVDDIPFGEVTVRDITTPIEQWQDRLLFPKDLIFGNTSEDGKLREWSGIYSMADLTAASAKFSLRFTWDKGSGLQKKQFPVEITVKPKTNKILRLKVEGTENENRTGNIILVTDDEEWDEEDSENLTLTE